jgi:hypothetical protein
MRRLGSPLHPARTVDGVVKSTLWKAVVDPAAPGARSYANVDIEKEKAELMRALSQISSSD